MRKNSYDFSGTKHQIINESEINNKNIFHYTGVKCNSVNYIKSLFKPPFATPSVIIKKNILNKFKFNENIRHGEDFDLWLRILRFNRGYKINLPLTYTYKHDYLSSSSKSLSGYLKRMHESNNKIFINHIKNEEYFLYKIIIFFALIFEQIKYLKRIIHSYLFRFE